jgi:hypothetical protein
MQPFVIHRDSDRLYTFRQPQNEAEWQQVLEALGKGADIVKLNAPDEGPAGFSDDYGATLGLRVHLLTIEPRGDGPLLAQIEGVFVKPDSTVIHQADEIVCDRSRKVGLHCTHGFDRTGFERARERVMCEDWEPERAHEEWHVRAEYFPHGVRIPSPGLEQAWEDFVLQYQQVQELLGK